MGPVRFAGMQESRGRSRRTFRALVIILLGVGRLSVMPVLADSDRTAPSTANAHVARASESNPTNTVPGEPVPTRLPLWKVQGRHNTVYLLGAIHLLKKENYPLPDPIEAAFRDSPIAVFETDFTQLAQPEEQQKLADKARLPFDQTLKEEVSPTVYARLQEELETAGLDPDAFDRLKPAVAALAVEVFLLQRRGFRLEYGLDQYFFNRAQHAGKRIVALEAPDYQIDLVTSFTPEEGEWMLKAALDQAEHSEKTFTELLQAWQAGDTGGLRKVLHSAQDQSPAVFQRMVTDRNRQWLPRIQELLRGGQNAIVIVGAGHLVGPEGLLNLLARSGAKPVQVQNPP